MQPFQKKPKLQSRKSAFSLIEMLVVIAIIAILMAAGVAGLSGMEGKGVTSGVATAESLFDEARTTAVGRNLRSCVLVAKTLTNNTSEDLRRIIVAYEPTDPNTGIPTTPAGSNVSGWVLSSRGAVLPEQTFFSKKFSKQLDTSGSPGTAINEVTLSNAKASYQGTYFIYEFNSQGIPAYPNGASFVIGSGARNPSQSSDTAPPKVKASAKRDFGGFVIWLNGRTSVFRSPQQISTTINSINSGDEF
ncbi:MAG: prepilin-type N-terminal cleavage/methylation domain-containing protein [Gloeobacteraceae cyanobacterium ES-bin-144]|nr:prepilin-type N-terminal cleavage/methylation domain-containing protein [Verrucomicrobiales bacterium]